MDKEKLISKKELLARYNISYGSLYRWKRMGLIPDEWFIKKSTVTGQETFFNEAVICERIELIISQKDTTSLEILADRLNPSNTNDRLLVIETSYGTKQYKLCEIKNVSAVSEDGEVLDITDNFRKIFDDLKG